MLSIFRSIPIYLSILVIAVLKLIEYFFMDAFIRSPIPNFEWPALLRTLLIVGVSFVLVVALVRRRTTESDQDAESSAFLTWAKWGMLLLNFAVVVLLFVNPTLFARLQFEDSVVEYLSALFLFVASGACLYAGFSLRHSNIADKRLKIALLVGLGFVLFVVGMEEISWGQRVVGFETPAFMGGNTQDEFNLHNFSSNLSEEIYYTVGFLFLVVLPFGMYLRGGNRQQREQWIILPGAGVLYASAIMAAYNYNLWNRTVIQWAFFCTLLIAIYLAIKALETRRIFPFVLLASLILTQGVFLFRGDLFLVEWSVTEYKELLIPLGFTIYSLDLVYRIRKSQRVLLNKQRISETEGLPLRRSSSRSR